MFDLITAALTELEEAFFAELEGLSEKLWVDLTTEFTNPMNYIFVPGSLAPPILINVPNAVVLNLLELPSRLSAIPARVLTKVAVQNIPLAPSLRNRVMTVQDAVRLVCYCMVDLPLETLLRPVPVEWTIAKWISGKWKFWKLITGAFSSGLWASVIGKVKLIVERLVSATITIAGTIVILMALKELARRLQSDVLREELLRAALPQDSGFQRVRGKRRVRSNRVRPGRDVPK